MNNLNSELRRSLVKALLALPLIETEAGRNLLLSDLPQQLRATIARSQVPLIDLQNILDAADNWDDKQLGVLLSNAETLVSGSDLARELNGLRERLNVQKLNGTITKTPYRAPLPPDPWIERPEFFRVRDSLLAGGLSTLTAAEGRGGIGKTSLAAMIAWDQSVRANFTEGVLWVSLGEQPDVLGELARLALYFGVDVEHHGVRVDSAHTLSVDFRYGVVENRTVVLDVNSGENAAVHERTAIVRNLMAGRRCLLIIDDAWDAEAALVFRGLEPTAALLTTRNHEIARTFAPARNDVTIELLTLDASVALLKELAPSASASPYLTKLADIAAGLPLTLRLIAPLLEDETRMGWGFDELLSQVESIEWRGKLLDALVEKSLAFLPDDDRNAFVQLAVFGARPNTFNLSAAASIWGTEEDAARERIRRFVDRNLLDPGPGVSRFSLHQSLADVASTRLPSDDVARTQYLFYYLRSLNQEEKDNLFAERGQIGRVLQMIPSEPEHLLDFIREGGLFQESLLCERKYHRFGSYLTTIWVPDHCSEDGTLLIKLGALYLLSDEKEQALNYFQQALLLYDVTVAKEERAVALANVGACYVEMSRWELALESYEQALVLWRALSNHLNEATILFRMGQVHARTGKPEEALKFFEQALSIAEVEDAKSLQARVHDSIGDVYFHQLNVPKEGLKSYNRSLVLWKELDERREQIVALLSIGGAYLRMVRPKKALEYNIRALQLSMSGGSQFLQASALKNIGMAYSSMGYYSHALKHYHRALLVWEADDDDRSQADTLTEIGLAYSGLRASEQSINYYQKALFLWRKVGSFHGEAFVLYSIGRQYVRRRKIRNAINYYEQALGVLRRNNSVDRIYVILDELSILYLLCGKIRQSWLVFRQIKLSAYFKQTVFLDAFRMDLMRILARIDPPQLAVEEGDHDSNSA